jgi:hypothetical protein
MWAVIAPLGYNKRPKETPAAVSGGGRKPADVMAGEDL